MTEDQNPKRYDLEERTYLFAKRVRGFVKHLPMSVISNPDDARQVARASGSVASNYIEANESLSKKDFLMRIKISRKEAKECRLWLRLVDIAEQPKLEKECLELLQEATELMKIFGSILRKSE
jgi:four helix bundle protein